MKKRLCFVVSQPWTFQAFLAPHLAALQEGYSVTLVANFRSGESPAVPEIDVVPAPIDRRISLARDARALLALAGVFRRNRFDIVHSVTPKAGLLAMVAARIARVPLRLHTFTGQVWATHTGTSRVLLRAIDRLTAWSATHVLVDSPSQREFLVANRVVSLAKSSVLANGSICGVDAKRFRPDGGARAKIRAELRIPEDAVVFLYLGRLSRDKGVLDLARAFAGLAREHALARLVLVGPDEDGLRSQIEQSVAECSARVRVLDRTDRPESYMAAADVFCLPSYREGFGQVALEAAASGSPVIASRIYGVVDAVVHGETGLLHPPADIDALRVHMQTLLLHADLRLRLGNAGRARALRDFSTSKVTQALLDYYAAISRKL